ncbi:unnamed protein product [Linum tenue]|uniref:Ubiquitinyl hydrolase 1 n=1 Tax=Linum tenue TaxID=586396 RepID=A0AAV0NZG6_9ROSI|nr:unnamed protein product [Linum tenue]CAI0463583.1 unnamed protein product [Linum tenue]
MEVSLWAIELLMKERAREIVQRCGCRLHETHGLPCKCKMDALSDAGMEATRHRLGRRTAGSCTQEYWFEEVDLLTFATLYNCAIVVYGLYNERTTYGYTVLPLTAPEGVTQPSQVITLAFTGAHWVRLYFGEVDGVTPIPHFSPQWSHFRDMLRIADWDSLYEPGRQLYVHLGGHHPANDDDKSD